MVNFYIGKIYTSELTGFVDFILDVKGIDDDGDERTRSYSIWNDFVEEECEDRTDEVLYILYNMKVKLGDDQLKRLMNHGVNRSCKRAILQALLKGKPKNEVQEYLNKFPMLADYLTSETDQREFLFSTTSFNS